MSTSQTHPAGGDLLSLSSDAGHQAVVEGLRRSIDLLAEVAAEAEWEPAVTSALRSTLLLAGEAAFSARKALAMPGARASRAQAELLLQEMLLVTGAGKTWNTFLDLLDTFDDAAAAEPGLAAARSDSPFRDLVRSWDALEVATSGRDVLLALVRLWRDSCRCAAVLFERLSEAACAGIATVRLEGAA